MSRGAALALLAAGASALGAAALAPAPAPPPPPAPGAMESVSATEPGFAPPPGTPSQDLSAFRERPPFSAARRPPPPPVPTVAAPAPAPPPPEPDPGLLFGRWEVLGVVATGPGAVALLRDARDGGLRRVRVGERLGDAELLAADMGALTFRAGNATVTATINGDEQAR